MGVNNISIINSAYSALEVASAGMTVTSQNVAGSSIDGFTRRQSNSIISHRALNSWDFGNTAFSVEGFTRYTDRLLDAQLREQKSKSSFTASLLQTVKGLDTSMMDPSSSIAEAMSSFFNAAGTLASNTSSTTNIQDFAAKATQVATRISTFTETINLLGESTRLNLTAILDEANAIAPALARINLDILTGSVPGNATPAADVLDERDRLLTRLQDLLGGKTIIHTDGTATFQIGGMALVDGQVANHFVNTDVSTSAFNVQLQSENIDPRYSDGRKVNIGYLSTEGASLTTVTGSAYQSAAKTAFTGGQAGAAFTILTDFIPKIQRQVSAIALVFARDVNAVKQKDDTTGITPIFGYKNTSTSGLSVITNASPDLGSYTVNQLVDMADRKSANYNPLIASIVNGAAWNPALFVSNINFGSNTVLSIDSTAANAIEKRRNSFSTPLSLLTNNVASTISSWKAQDKANISVATQLQNRKESVSGVNLDEEAANLVKFQQLYGAASKVMQTANQMFATLLSAMNAA
ncbi:flagellar hook-associated protein FlgK [Polynucleobacter corsicus]|uniref:flagellar hook-associated protein FlgK n=1 Tax=Polynucleobacter corsicus TaxID=2081042 RepID=UPI001BFE0364|nr:flagellar hook-associated protein FlgK [Polynucleobacter corsicus]QWE19334.1 flagellar hook-associated protein FlgK [Polynucleobacter corsicus]